MAGEKMHPRLSKKKRFRETGTVAEVSSFDWSAFAYPKNIK